MDTHPQSPDFGPGRRLAIVIGVNGSRCSHKPPPLRYAQRDATDFASTIQSEHCGFEIYTQLLGVEATTQAVRQEILRAARDLTDDDVVIFYFSGHGIPIAIRNGNLVEIYLVTSDFLRDDVEIDEQSHISLSYIRNILYFHARARQIIIILDCCFAGEYGRLAENPHVQDIESRLQYYFGEPPRESKVRAGGLRQALTATGHDTEATEIDGKSMTRVMLPVLRGEIIDEVADTHGHILLNELWGYLSRHPALKHQSPSLPGDPAGQPCPLAWYPHLTSTARKHRAEAEHAQKLDQHFKRIEDKIEGFQHQLSGLQSSAEFDQLQDPYSPFDRSVCKSSQIKDILTDTFDQFCSSEQLYKQEGYEPDLAPDELLHRLGWLQKGYPTYAALLCFAHQPVHWVPGASIRCILWPGKDRRPTPLEDRRLAKDLLSQYSEAIVFLQQFLQLSRVIRVDDANDIWEIPFKALREAVANALIHREYDDRQDEIGIEIFQDRVEITSPGHLVQPLQVEDLYSEGPGPLRNSLIARIFYIRGHVETLGGGIFRIQEALAHAGLRPALFKEVTEKSFTKFRVIIYRPMAPNPDQLTWPSYLELPSDAWKPLLDTMPRDAVPPISPLPRRSRMPYAPNPYFVGREAMLLALATAMHGGERVAIGPKAAVTGLGGIGKTSVVAEFVHRYGSYFAGGVFWLSCADPAAIPSEIAACGGPALLDLHPSYGDLKQDNQVALVRQAWQRPIPRLLIFDSCEDPALVQQWAPTSGGCRILLTSRRQSWPSSLHVQIQRLDVFARVASMALLRDLALRLTAEEADILADELGDFPLALELAGSYLAALPQITVASYITSLRSDALLAHPSLRGIHDDVSITAHDRHVARTFLVSSQQLDSTRDALPLTLLGRAASFAPGVVIPYPLLLDSAERENDNTTGQVALSRLTDLGLVVMDVDGIIIHRLIHAFVKQTMQGDRLQVASEQSLIRQGSAINEAGYPETMQPLIPHLSWVTRNLMGRMDGTMASLCNVFGYHLYVVGKYDQAQPFLEHALAIYNKILSFPHFQTAASLYTLAALYKATGDYALAQSHYEQALLIREQTLGVNHPDTATSLSSLAGVYQEIGNYTQAQPLLEKALVIHEQTLGPTHPATAGSLNNLAGLYYATGNYAAAQPLYVRALAINEATLGPTHPTIATSLNNLAELYRATGDYAAAQPLYVRALAINEATLGPTHPTIATSLNNLAELHRAMGGYAAAQPLYVRALAISEQRLGPTHPQTATSLHNLAGLLEATGAYGQAQPLYEQALAIREQALGPTHPETATSLNNLAVLYRARGDYTQAQPLYERALAIREQVLGPTHPQTASSLNNLAELYYARGDYAAAQPLYERALAISEQTLGPTHPATATSLNNLATLDYATGSYAQALLLLERALAISEQTLGPTHPQTAQSLHNLAALYYATGDYGVALPLYERALAIHEQILGPTHPATATSLHNFAGLREAMGDYGAALPLYERALVIREQTLGPTHPDTAQSLNNLAALYYAIGDYRAALPLFERELAIHEQTLGPDHPATQTIRANLQQVISMIESADDQQDKDNV